MKSENTKLKKLLAEAHLDFHSLKSVRRKALAPKVMYQPIGKMVQYHRQ